MNMLLAQSQTPQLLKEPSDWQFERFALPPSFAPTIPCKGAEELRFSPGMFVKDSATYFSYAFVAEFDDTKSVSQADIQNYLFTYFKGLCSSTAKNRNLTIDTSQISVFVEMKNHSQKIYSAVLHIFGVFADGAPVTLNMEIKEINDVKTNKTYLLFIASPHDKTNVIWKRLYEIQQDFTLPE